jgi:hypothetical protein
VYLVEGASERDNDLRKASKFISLCSLKKQVFVISVTQIVPTLVSNRVWDINVRKILYIGTFHTLATVKSYPRKQQFSKSEIISLT